MKKIYYSLIFLIIFFAKPAYSQNEEYALEENDDVILSFINKVEFYNDKMYVLDKQNNNFVIYDIYGKMLDYFKPSLYLSDSVVKHRNKIPLGIERNILFLDELGNIPKEQLNLYYRHNLGDFSIKNDSIVYISLGISYPAKVEMPKTNQLTLMVSGCGAIVEYNIKSKKSNLKLMKTFNNSYFEEQAICCVDNYIYGSCFTSTSENPVEYGQRGLICNYNEKGDYLSQIFCIPKEIDNKVEHYPSGIIIKKFNNDIWIVLQDYPKIYCLDSTKSFNMKVINNNKKLYEILSKQSTTSDSLADLVESDPLTFTLDTKNKDIMIKNFWIKNDSIYVVINRFAKSTDLITNEIQCYSMDGKFIREMQTEGFPHITPYKNKLVYFRFDGIKDQYFLTYKDYWE